MSLPEIQLLLTEERHRGLCGRLMTVDSAADDGRVCVLFEGSRWPLLALGEQVEIELSGTFAEAGVQGRARVLQHRAGSGVAFYVLELPAECRGSLEGLFERRSSARARPAVIAPIDGTLSAPDGSLARSVAVKDLSATGAGLFLRPPEELELLSQAGMRLVFSLPGESSRTELRVRLATRRPAGSQLHYGVVFDAAATPGFREMRARIEDWVAQRAAGSTGRIE